MRFHQTNTHQIVMLFKIKIVNCSKVSKNFDANFDSTQFSILMMSKQRNSIESFKQTKR